MICKKDGCGKQLASMKKRYPVKLKGKVVYETFSGCPMADMSKMPQDNEHTLIYLGLKP